LILNDLLNAAIHLFLHSGPADRLHDFQPGSSGRLPRSPEHRSRHERLPGLRRLGWTGNPIIHTPHIDAFAKESIRFTDFHVSPTCSPTRCALVTGRHEFRSGVTHTIFERERMSLKAVTIPQVLKSAGYTTGIFASRR